MPASDGIMDVVRGHIPHLQLVGQIHQPIDQRIVTGQEVMLQLNPETVGAKEVTVSATGRQGASSCR